MPRTIDAQLAALRDAGRAHADPPTRTWWGPYRHMPSGHRDAIALGQLDFESMYAALTFDCAEAHLLEPLHKLQAKVAEYRERDPVPLALVSLRVRRLRGSARKCIQAAVHDGAELAPASIDNMTRTRHVFMLGALRHQQWGRAQPVHHGRVVRFRLDERLLYNDYETARPRDIEFDADDGLGIQSLSFGDTLLVRYADAGIKTLTITALANGKRRVARAVLEVVEEEPAPAPDERWTLIGSWSSRGHAFVYRAHAGTGPRRFVIVSEGFPGGYSSDYLYRMLNQHGTLEQLRKSGYDVVLMGYLNGADYIERNADVVDACLRTARDLSDEPLVVGGVSMGGLVTRYALTRAEARGLEHRVRLFFTIDTPHTGSYTSLAAQWFAQYFAQTMPLMGLFSALLASPANQQFVRLVLQHGKIVTSPLRKAFLQSLADYGDYPRLPFLFAIASGRGDGHVEAASDTLLSWQGSPLTNASLKVTRARGAADDQPTVGVGHSWLATPNVPSSVQWADEFCWEDMPGGQNDYGQIIAYAALWTQCGQIEAFRGQSCSIPTASALGMAHVAPDEAIPHLDDPNCWTPFDDFVAADENLSNVEFSATAGLRLLEHVGVLPSKENASVDGGSGSNSAEPEREHGRGHGLEQGQTHG